jgi:hypothetical protein
MRLAKAVVIVALWPLWAALTVALAQPAHADPTPVKCVDVPNFFGIAAHVCKFSDGTITNCAGIGCIPVPPGQLPPGFWDNGNQAPEHPYEGKP